LIRLAASDAEWAEREVLLQVVTLEDGLSTRVGAGELAGHTYNGRYTARTFTFRAVTLPREGDVAVDFQFALPPGARADRTSLAILVQDEATGRILQARRLAWQPAEPAAGPPEAEDASKSAGQGGRQPARPPKRG
jgi:hypothetical protein